MTYQTDFPDFNSPEDLAAVAAIPEGFEDRSYRNDMCPSFWSEARRLVIWTDYADAERSEWPEERASGAMKRFAVYPTDEDSAHATDLPVFESDDLAAVLAFVASPLDVLSAEFGAWTKAQGIPEEEGGDATELLMEERTPEQRAWLEAFVGRWDALASEENHQRMAVVPAPALSFDQITDDAHRMSLFRAAEGHIKSTSARDALVEAFNALKAAGGSPGALLTVCDLLGQRGLVDEADEPMLGARDDFLTSVADTAMRG